MFLPEMEEMTMTTGFQMELAGGGGQQKAAFRVLHEGKLLTHSAESKRNDLQG